MAVSNQPIPSYRVFAIACAGVVALTAPVGAQEQPRSLSTMPSVVSSEATPDEPREWFGLRPWVEWQTVTGDWASMRSRLRQHGIDIAAAETADVSRVRTADGHQVVSRGLFDSTITAGADVLKVPGATAVAQVQWYAGGNGSAAFGDLQGFSNIDADAVPFLGELWYEQRFGDRVRAKIGRVDANSDFAFVEAASDFLSSSMGFSPSIVAMPSYPTPASSASLFLQPSANVEFGGGVFNGSPDDNRWIGWNSQFAIAQASATWTARGLGGRITTGGWNVRFDDPAANETSGLYLTAEQTVWSAAERNAAVFAQVGSSDETSEIARHVGGGVAVRGVSRRRPLDVTGIGATWVRFASEGDAQAAELVMEFFHRVSLTPSISLIPDVQVIQSPSGDVSRGRTAAFTCRARFDF